jgi:CheY-like chemotaxis protein
MLGEKISLSLEIEPDLPAIEAEQGQVEQVLVNLIVNSRDAIDGFGNVKIRIMAGGGPSDDEQGEQYVHLFVQDDGEGMEKETQARMFEPYFSTKPSDKGTGLGLSIVYGILQQSGGHVQVESAPGEGTTMKLFFPASDNVPVNLEPEKEVDLELQGKKRILLVEDEDVVRSLASATLQYAGYEVIEASDGADAVEIFTGHSGEFDLVVTDVVMPKMGGREFMQTVASSHPEMKVLYMSGHIADEELQNEIVRDGVPFLSKPFKPSELTKKILEVLDGS